MQCPNCGSHNLKKVHTRVVTKKSWEYGIVGGKLTGEQGDAVTTYECGNCHRKFAGYSQPIFAW